MRDAVHPKSLQQSPSQTQTQCQPQVNDSVETNSEQASGSKSQKRQRWTTEQTNVLVKTWKENFDLLESSRQYSAWLKIKTAVDAAGPAKTMKQCKDKIRNLKDGYKSAKLNNKQTGTSPIYAPFYDDFDEILGDRDCVNTPNVT